MANYENCRSITQIAGSAVTIGRFVKRAADGQCDHVGVAQADVDGICAEDQATVGRAFPMIVPDGCIAKVEAGAAINDGDLIATDNVGRAIVHVAAVDNVCVGRAQGTVANAGEFVSIQFMIMRVDAG